MRSEHWGRSNHDNRLEVIVMATNTLSPNRQLRERVMVMARYIARISEHANVCA
jgi:hypothetical protein